MVELNTENTKNLIKALSVSPLDRATNRRYILNRLRAYSYRSLSANLEELINSDDDIESSLARYIGVDRSTVELIINRGLLYDKPLISDLINELELLLFSDNEEFFNDRNKYIRSETTRGEWRALNEFHLGIMRLTAAFQNNSN